MTATGTTAGALPPAQGTASGLPPALPAGFDAGTTGGGATTTTPSTTLPTAGTTTSFDAAATATGGGFKAIPAPGCDTAPPVQQLPGQVAGANGAPPIKGGGGGGDLASALGSLTAVIQQLQTAVGGVAGGGPAQKPAGPEQKTDVAGATGSPAQKTDVAGSGGPAQKPCDMNHATGGGASASTVAGANGAPAANAAQAAAQVQGGGGAANSEAIVAALKGLVEVLNQLVTALAGANGGGPAGKPGQVPPSDVKGDNGGPAQMPTQVPPSDVKGDNGGPAQVPTQVPTQAPPKTDVDGAHGKPEGKPPVTPPATPPVTPPPVTPPVLPVPPAPPSQVDGVNGGPGQAPGQTPVQAPVPAKPPTDVDGATGGPAQTPAQTPTQTPVQKPSEVAGAREGNVKLDNDDERWSAKLTSGAGKTENSVELWGDPHVVITVGGKAEKFDIGFGTGDVTLFDGTKVTWDTYAKGEKLAGQRPGANDDVSYILRDFKVDSAGAEFDRSVTTRDRNGDKGDQMGLTTALTDAHLKELAVALRTMQGPMSDPLKNGTWVSPAFQSPGQTPGQTPGQAPGQTTRQSA